MVNCVTYALVTCGSVRLARTCLWRWIDNVVSQNASGIFIKRDAGDAKSFQNSTISKHGRLEYLITQITFKIFLFIECTPEK